MRIRRLPELVRFGLAGLVSLLVDVGALVALVNLGVLPLAANTAVAFAVGALVNFALTRQWVFVAAANGVSPAGDLVRYVLLVCADLVLTAVAVPVLVRAGLDYRLAKLVASGLVAAVNYSALPGWVFSTGQRI